MIIMLLLRQELIETEKAYNVLLLNSRKQTKKEDRLTGSEKKTPGLVHHKTEYTLKKKTVSKRTSL